MRRITRAFLVLLLLFSTLFIYACGVSDIQGVIDNNTNEPLDVPENLRVEDAVLCWNSVEYASGYTVLVNGTTTFVTHTNSFSLQVLKSGEYTLAVKANGDGLKYKTSEYSDSISYTRVTDTGAEYEDEVIGAFGSFDEINTKNSFLGYGIDIIKAPAITSKNVLMTYPIFDMDKLMEEKLLKSNEHYNSFVSIEAETIESFSKNMSTSTSISSGANVSAKGNIYGADVGASVSASSGLTTCFTKTSEDVQSQYFLEIIAENQSYWLILQTSEARYKDILSDEFKKDLYDSSMTPSQLFDKYGTHLLTSVAMGGNISMYYTMFSYSEMDLSSKYASISSSLKTNVEAAYGGASAGVGAEGSFEKTYAYETIAQEYGIQIDKIIISSGGGSFGINNEKTLYENYFDWQKSLDIYPVVIGIKDTNSLYPIWQLLDLNVEGASERYNELYGYFCEYGLDSYNALCETYSITPSVSPMAIENISVGALENYTEGQIVQVKSGDTMKISFDVLPENANKYVKTFYVDKPEIATIDSTGLLTILPAAKGGDYIKVTVGAGSISKQITLYVINTFNVNFNTRVNGLYVESILGILEGYSIEPPSISRVGYILEGWYRDSENTVKFDFENDSVTENMTLFAKWVAIKPTVTFDSMEGSAVESVTVAYNASASKPKNPTRSGYSFDGWYEDEEYTVKYDFSTALIGDITLYAKWEKIEYTVFFEANGAAPIAPISTSITEGYKIGEVVPARTYYNFEGWYKDPAFTQKFYFETEITGNITLYAKWSPVTVIVNFVDTDGSQIGTAETDATKEFKVVEAIPLKDGYTFDGWYLNGTLIDLNTYSEFKPQENAYRLMAKWRINTYTVTYEIDGEIYRKETYNFGEDIITVPVDVEGYEFGGWKYGNKNVPDTMPSKDITLNGKLTIRSFTLDYYVDGEFYTSDSYKYGEEIVYVGAPASDGKVFSGWSYANGDLPAVMPANDIRIDGGFDRVEYTITYYIDNVAQEPITVKKGYEIPEYIPQKEGYTFSGWRVIKDGAESVLPSTMPAEDLNVYGSFAINSYTVVFDTDGGSEVASITAEYGAAITTPADPTKIGYKFTGWDEEIPETMPAENKTIKAVWEIKSYTIIFNTDGGSEVASITAEYGAVITKPQNPTKIGYTFKGWSEEIPATMPAENKTIKAVWEIKSYTIIFNTDGGSEIASITAEYGAAITTPADPTKIGYKFIGWDEEIPETMPHYEEGYVTINAGWKVKKISINYDINNSTYTGSFSIQGEVDCATYSVTSTLKLGISDTYYFQGWFATAASGGVQVAGSDGALLKNVSGYTDGEGKWIYETTDSVTLYAGWTPKTFTISYHANGGSGTTLSSNHTYDTPKAMTANGFTRSGYAFLGWSDSDSAQTPTYANGANGSNISTQNITLYAVWVKVETTIGYYSREIEMGSHAENFYPQLDRDSLKANGYTGLTLTIEIHGTGKSWSQDEPYFIIYSHKGVPLKRFDLADFDLNTWQTQTITYTISLDNVQRDGSFSILYGNDGGKYHLGTVEINIKAVK